MVSSLTRKIDERGEYAEFECVHCRCDMDYSLREAEELGAQFECPYCDGVNDGFARGGVVSANYYAGPWGWGRRVEGPSAVAMVADFEVNLRAELPRTIVDVSRKARG